MGTEFLQKQADRRNTCREIRKRQMVDSHRDSLFGRSASAVADVYRCELGTKVKPGTVQKGDHLFVLKEGEKLVVLKQSKQVGELLPESCVELSDALGGAVQGCIIEVASAADELGTCDVRRLSIDQWED